MTLTSDKVIELDEYDSQLVYYAKGHFTRGNTISDIRKILGWRSDIDPDHISDRDIIIVLCGLIHQLGLSEKISDYQFFSEIIFGGRYGLPIGDDDRTPLCRFVDAILSEICAIPVRESEKILVKLTPITVACGLTPNRQ